MNTSITNILLFFSILCFTAFACKKDPNNGGGDSDLAARKCDNGSLCAVGFTCEDNICNCPDGTFFTGGFKYGSLVSEGDSMCEKINNHHFILDRVEGDSQFFLEELQVLELLDLKPSTSPISDTAIMAFYHLQRHRNGTELMSNHPLVLDFIQTIANSGDINTQAFKKNISVAVWIPGIYSWEWYLEYGNGDFSLDSIVVTVNYINSNDEAKTTILHYKRVGAE